MGADLASSQACFVTEMLGRITVMSKNPVSLIPPSEAEVAERFRLSVLPAATSFTVVLLGIAAAIALAVVAGFVLLMAKTRLGRSLRAAADNPEAATYMGIDVDRVYRLAFAFGIAITAIGGGLLASTNPFQPYIGIEFVIVMYAGVVLGGLGSVGGAFFGGLIIGLVQQLSALVLPTQLQNTSIFVCFLLIVLIRPQGLFGRLARRA